MPEHLNHRSPKRRRQKKGHEKRNPESPKQDKCPPNQTKEEEIGNLPDKEFRIIIVKMIQNLEKKNGVTDK